MKINSSLIKTKNIDFKILLNEIGKAEENNSNNVSKDNDLNNNKNLCERFIKINDDRIQNNLSDNNEGEDNEKKNNNEFLGKKRNNKKVNGSFHKKSNLKKKIIINNNIRYPNNPKSLNEKERNVNQNHKCKPKKNNYYQIINIFPIIEDKSKINNNLNEKNIEEINYEKDTKNMSDMEEINSSWINYINEVISMSKVTNEKKENKNNEKKEEKKLDITLNIKDSLNFSFKEKNNINESFNYTEASCSSKKEKYLSIPNSNVNSSYEICQTTNNYKKIMEINDGNNN